MSDDKELHNNLSMLQHAVYLLLFIEFLAYIVYDSSFLSLISPLILKIKQLFLYSGHNILYSKLFTLVLIIIVSIGTRPKKQITVSVLKQIVLPISIGLLIFFGASIFYFLEPNTKPDFISSLELFYMISSLLGAVLIHIGFDNISKIIYFNLGEDKFNNDNEAFLQPQKIVKTPFSLNLPILFYYKKKIHKGWFNLTNPFRGSLVIGTPESGKSYSIIVPFIKKCISRGFTMLVYDQKYPTLAKMTYHHYLLLKQNPKYDKYRFHVINLSDVEYSRRINPLNPKYLKTLGSCIETAEALMQALKKGDKSGGTDQFFTQSAINYLAAVIYFFTKYEGGKYSTLPHVLSFLTRDIGEIFDTLSTQVELESLLSPFSSAYKNKAFSQLEQQYAFLNLSKS